MYQNINKIYHAAIYVRLSKEDGDISSSAKLESNSISNQKALILDFLKDKKDIEVVSVRVDDGYSGSNFERPAFQAMLEDIRRGIVDCVVVKDLSRFGREYIDSGKYIERLFPALGVRFIAINDNYDSLKGKNQADEIIIPFKNLINDAYCRDISIKIRSNLEIKRKKGECVTPFVAFGYRKTKTDKHTGKGSGRCRTGDAETAYPEYPAPEKSPGICWYCAISGDQYEEAAGQAGEEKTGDRTL